MSISSKIIPLLAFLFLSHFSLGQGKVDLKDFDTKSGSIVKEQGEQLSVSWPIGNGEKGTIVLDMQMGNPLIHQIKLGNSPQNQPIISDLDPMFLLTVGQRDLSKESGWNIFFDRTAYKPYEAFQVDLKKENFKVSTNGQRTLVEIGEMNAGSFSGHLEMTFFHGSPLLNMAAVIETQENAKAIIYDAGLVNRGEQWKEIFWSDTEGYIQSEPANSGNGGSKNLAVKYRTIIGESEGGSLAIFPPPHQYFYPLDNAYNLKYVWYGEGYREMEDDFGLGIRHELMGDRRHVPWFNAPPGTQQRLNFFIHLSGEKDGQSLEKVKAYTHGDQYKPLDGYRTMASHFHTEHMNDVLTHKPLPEIPGHVKALRSMGVNIMHLGEYHLAGNPRDPGPRRLPELELMFDECKRLSEGDFLMLPGEEPNCHFGGHWMNLFPKPVYWIMSREEGQPFVEDHPKYGKIYRVGNQEELLKLLDEENGLAWTAHARTKGSTGYPDKYKEEAFFASERFNGAAWKAIPADLSISNMGQRVLNLMDDMANWGHQKYVIGEADLFKLEPDYEIYGHMNVNYLQMDKLPKFEEGWQPVLDAMENGKFFVSTGEVLMPHFSVEGHNSGETLALKANGKATLKVKLDWTFPMNYLEIISGNGQEVFRERISLKETQSFGKQSIEREVSLKGKTWVRVEAWDVAANGAFSQPIWIK